MQVKTAHFVVASATLDINFSLCVYSNLFRFLCDFFAVFSLYSHFIIMGKSKESTSRSSRLLKRLESHNESPALQDDKLVDQGEDEGHTDGGRSRSNSREQRSRRDSRSHDRSRHRHSHTSSRRSESRNEERGSSRRHSSRSKDSVERARSRSEEPPAWAKDILENQQKTAHGEVESVEFLSSSKGR